MGRHQWDIVASKVNNSHFIKVRLSNHELHNQYFDTLIYDYTYVDVAHRSRDGI